MLCMYAHTTYVTASNAVEIVKDDEESRCVCECGIGWDADIFELS